MQIVVKQWITSLATIETLLVKRKDLVGISEGMKAQWKLEITLCGATIR